MIMMTKARKQQLTLGLCGIVVAWIASAALELVLFGGRALVPVVVTTIGAALAGQYLIRKMTTPHRRASITVEDLRGRPLERR